MKKKKHKYKILGVYRKEHDYSTWPPMQKDNWIYTQDTPTIGSFSGDMDSLKNEIRELSKRTMLKFAWKFNVNPTKEEIAMRPVVHVKNLTTDKITFYRVVRNNNVIELDEDEIIFLTI